MLEKEDDDESNEGAYKWVKDFRMDLKNNVEDQFAFVIDGSSAEYSSVGSHFDIAKSMSAKYSPMMQLLSCGIKYSTL